ncbi:MAG: hypothetical protein HWE23_02440 [Rhodobacteraceae bacterium]|nr:hypothetical protein [Paracoccaceae bacterium]
MKDILFISYFAGVDANCPAEWADDRLRTLAALDFETTVLTNYGSHLKDTTNTQIYKIPSLSSDDFKHELALRKQFEVVNGPSSWILKVIVRVFGTLLQALTHFLTRGGSGGMWSWVICGIPTGLWLSLTKRIEVIYCTGGPPSAYLIGVAVKWVKRVPLKIEFQDPLVGAETNNSNYKQRMVRTIERFLIKNSDLVVYVTRKAAEDSRKRYPEFGDRIIHNYPAAWDFDLQRDKSLNSKKKPLEILHLGTLYGSRNLDKFFRSLDKLYADGEVERGTILITNQGSVYTDNADEYARRDDFRLLKEKSRLEALQVAQNADFLLLVQHDDNRSAETIPYKLYDYANLKLPIIMLVKNPEIKELFPQYEDFIADCGDEQAIKDALSSAICGHRERQNIMNQTSEFSTLSVTNQVQKIMSFSL